MQMMRGPMTSGPTIRPFFQSTITIAFVSSGVSHGMLSRPGIKGSSVNEMYAASTSRSYETHAGILPCRDPRSARQNLP